MAARLERVPLQDPRLLAWAGDVLGFPFYPHQCRWLGFVEPGVGVRAVAVYDRFAGDPVRDCHVHLATDRSRRWASKRTVREILAVPFNEWRCRRVTFLVAATNAASLELCRRLGARTEGWLRYAFEGDVDGVLFGLLREQAQKWLTPNRAPRRCADRITTHLHNEVPHGKEIPAFAAAAA